jgi:hypothetical protein
MGHLVGVIVGVFALGFGGCCLTDRIGTAHSNPPSYSIRESKERGVYVCPVSVEPCVINWEGHEIVIKEAWLEKASVRPFWQTPTFYVNRITSGYFLCFNLSNLHSAQGVRGLYKYILHNKCYYM